jgi:hypothetical protein
MEAKGSGSSAGKRGSSKIDKPKLQNEQTLASYSEFKQTMRVFNEGGGCVVGNNIAAKQPDVEVLGVFLQDFPLSKSEFDKMIKESAKFGKTRDWVSLKFMILKVGPPGFSKVPYAEGQTYAEVKPLYGLDENDNVIVYPFEKIPNKNKNRGERKEFFKDEGGIEVDLKSKLIPGMVLSFCMREEIYNGNSIFLDLSKVSAMETAKANSFAFFQIQSTNDEQAKKGNGIKVKKLQVTEDYSQRTMAHVLPETNQQYEAVQTESKVLSLSKVMYSGGDRILQIKPDRNSYVIAIDREKNGYWLSYATEELPYIFINSEIAVKYCCLAEVGNFESMVKNILNVAIASGALSILVRNDKKHDYMMAGEEQNVEIKAIHLEIMWNKLIMLRDIQDFEMFPAKNSENIKMARNKDNMVYWYNPMVTFLSPNKDTQKEEKYRVVWSLKCKEASLKVPPIQGDANNMLSDGFAGKFYPLYLSLMLLGEENECEVFENNCLQENNLLLLKMYQWRPDFAGTRSILGKRDFVQIESMQNIMDEMEEA